MGRALFLLASKLLLLYTYISQQIEVAIALEDNKVGLWGGQGGGPVDVDIKTTGPPKRLKSVTIFTNRGDRSAIDSIAFTYIGGKDGKEHRTPDWGGPGGDVRRTITLHEIEHVTGVSGTYGTFQGSTVITSFKLVTNVRVWGPWGIQNGTHFCFTAPRIVGFYGRAGKFLDAIGVYVLGGC